LHQRKILSYKEDYGKDLVDKIIKDKGFSEETLKAIKLKYMYSAMAGTACN